MSKVLKWIEERHEEEKNLLTETPEDAHTHTLIIRRCESFQEFLEEHVPDNHHREMQIGHLQRMRELTGHALETKPSD